MRSAAEQLGLQALIAYRLSSPDHSQGVTSQLLDASRPPSAIVAGSHDLALGVLREVRPRHRVPFTNPPLPVIAYG